MPARPQLETLASRRAAAALFAGLLLRLFFLHIHPRFAGDALTYGDLAHNMLAHHIFGFTENVVRPTLIRLPGYPLFLAACFALFGNANYLAVLWVQIAFDLATCALLGVLATRLAGARAGLATLWLAALCPFTANYAVAALTETLSLFCVTLAFFGLERWGTQWRSGRKGLGWAGITGGALAFAVLIRPDQGLLAAVVVPGMVWIALRHRHGALSDGFLPAALASFIVILPLLVWTARNWRTFHVIQPLAPRYANDPGEGVPYGFQRWYRTWAIDFKSTLDVYWNYDGNTLNLADLPLRAFDDAQQLAQTRTLYAQYNEETTSSSIFDTAFGQIAAERVAAHPLRYYVVLPVARDLNMWLRPRTELMKLPVDWWAIRLHPKRSVFEIFYALLNAAYLALGLVGILRWRRMRWTGNIALATAVISFVLLRSALLLTLDNSEPRYTLECFPIVMLLAGIVFASRNNSMIDDRRVLVLLDSELVFVDVPIHLDVGVGRGTIVAARLIEDLFQ